MKTLLTSVVIFGSLCMNTAFADTFTPLSVCQKLSDLYQYSSATQCTHIVSSGASFDPNALPIVNKLIDLYQYSNALQALQTIENKSYSASEVSYIMDQINSYQYSTAMSSLSTLGRATVTAPSCSVDLKDLNARVKSIELLIVDRSQNSLDQAFLQLEKIRSILESQIPQ